MLKAHVAQLCFQNRQGDSTYGNKHLPHCVKQSAIVLQPQQLVGRGHVVSDWFLSIKEEGIGRPYVAGQQVVQRQHLHGTFEAQTLILPALTEEHVNGVFLKVTEKGWERLKIALNATAPSQEGKNINLKHCSSVSFRNKDTKSCGAFTHSLRIVSILSIVQLSRLRLRLCFQMSLSLFKLHPRTTFLSCVYVIHH